MLAQAQLFLRWSPVEVPWKFLDDEGEELPDLLVSGCVDARSCSIFMFGRRMTRTRTWSKSALIVSRRKFVGIPSVTWTRNVPHVPSDEVREHTTR